MPRLRVGLPQVAYSFRRGEESTALKDTVSQPEAACAHDGDKDESENEQHTGTQQCAPQKTRGAIRKVVRLVRDGPAFQGADGGNGRVRAACGEHTTHNFNGVTELSTEAHLERLNDRRRAGGSGRHTSS